VRESCEKVVALRLNIDVKFMNISFEDYTTVAAVSNGALQFICWYSVML